MRSYQSLIFPCALLIVVGLAPHHALAQSSFATLEPLTFSTDYTHTQAEPRRVPSKSLSPVGDADPLDAAPDLSQNPLYACACGCGVFDVATSSMLPQGQGGMAWLEWDYMDQNRNRHGSHAAPPAENDDKNLRTDFYTAGVQYFFNRSWGVEAQIPVDHRHFVSDDGATDWTALGDARIEGLYTGFFPDQSVGVDFGLRFPTGDFTHRIADRDTEIGSGSTDILLGGFYRTNITADRTWNFFAQLQADLPVLIQDRYRPGLEVDAAAGVYYSGLSVHGVTITPVAQVIAAYRGSDGGDNSAHPISSGYQRLLLSPGVEFNFHPFTVYGDVEIPVYQYFRGDQLSAPAMFKVIVSYGF